MAGEGDGRIDVDIVGQTTHKNPNGTKDIGAYTIFIRADTERADVQSGGWFDNCAFCGGEIYITYRRAKEQEPPREE